MQCAATPECSKIQKGKHRNPTAGWLAEWLHGWMAGLDGLVGLAGLAGLASLLIIK